MKRIFKLLLPFILFLNSVAGVKAGVELPPGLTCDSGNGINTAIGCIPFNSPADFTSFLLSWGIGIAGGIAFILIVIASFSIITSAGNPQKLQQGQSLLTAALSGLFLVVFSAFLYRLIGQNILQIPGL